MKNEVYGKRFNTLYDGILVELSMEFDKYFPIKEKSGIIRPNDSTFRQEAGDFEEAKKLIYHGEIISVGPNCKQVKIGDEVYIDIRSTTLIPVKFGDKPVVRLNEQNVIVHITDKDNG